MSGNEWLQSSDELGPFDAAVLRCIAGEWSDDALRRFTQGALIDGRRRMASLLMRHRAPAYPELARLTRERRRALAEEILASELTKLDTAPGDLVPLAPVFARSADDVSWFRLRR